MKTQGLSHSKKITEPGHTMLFAKFFLLPYVDNMNIYYLVQMHRLLKWVVATVVLVMFCFPYLSEVKQDLYLERAC